MMRFGAAVPEFLLNVCRPRPFHFAPRFLPTCAALFRRGIQSRENNNLQCLIRCTYSTNFDDLSRRIYLINAIHGIEFQQGG